MDRYPIIELSPPERICKLTADSNTLYPLSLIHISQDLPGKRIGVQAGTTGETYIKENVADTAPISYKSGMEAAMDLMNSNLDAVVLDELPAKEIVRQNPSLKILDEPLTTEYYAIAVQKGNTELLDSINKTLQRIQEDGTYDKFKAAFMPEDGNIQVPELDYGDSDKTLVMGTNCLLYTSIHQPVV